MMFHDTVGEEEINSEVELIQSQDVLQKVVIACGLDKKSFLGSIVHSGESAQNRTDRAILQPARRPAAGSDQEDQHHQHRV